VKRRSLIGAAAGGLLGTLMPAHAQAPGKMVRIGWLWVDRKVDDQHPYWNAFRHELQRLGWSEGRNIVFEHRFAEGVEARFAPFARELVEMNVDVICVTGGGAAFAAKGATSTIPIVFVAAPNPVAIGLVPSLARPGGNLTGVASATAVLSGKRLEILKEAFPHISRVALLPFLGWSNHGVENAAPALGLQMLPARVRGVEDLPAAVAALADADAWYVQDDTLYAGRRKMVVDLLNQQRKPAIYPQTFFSDMGGLMSYSTDLKEIFRRAASYVDRILRGAKPGDLPVEEPARFELVINLKTATQLGLTIPKSVLLRADRVIE
jgi:putative ABC transport system substrate-binding protein